jgi:hypothetical protein|tara:strand:- start:226 stop:636 length:411 start_codon:yes stop_codon:yes gene_type:complete
MRIGLWSKFQRRVETPVIKGGKRITMSCGGGMAGSKWYEYATDIDMEGEFIDIIAFDGQSKLLGKQWVVSIIDVDFHGQVLDYEGKVTIEWYDVPKGKKVEHCNVERDRTQPTIMKPFVRKDLPKYYKNKKELING